MRTPSRPGPRIHPGRALLFVAAVLGTLAAGCTSYVELPSIPTARENAILILNGEPLSLEDYDNDFRLMAIHYSAVSEGDMRKMKRYLSERVIDQRLLYQEARRRGVRVSRKDFEEALRAASGESPEDFTLLLRKQGVTVEVWKRGVLQKQFIDRLTRREVFDKVRITDREIEDYYWTHLSEYQRTRSVRLRHLVVRNALVMADAKKRLKAGEPFEKVTAELSIGPSRAEGGEWEWKPMDSLPPYICDALSRVGEDGITETVRDSYGFHLFQVLERREKRMQTLEAVKDRIRAQLTKQEQGFRFDQWMTGLKEKAVIQVNRDMAPLVGEIPEVKRDR